MTQMLHIPKIIFGVSRTLTYIVYITTDALPVCMAVKAIKDIIGNKILVDLVRKNSVT
jgi:hypothetical protein